MMRWSARGASIEVKGEVEVEDVVEHLQRDGAPAACATGVNATDRSSVARPETALKAPLATSAHAAARRDAATAFESAEATAAAVRWSTAELEQDGHRQAGALLHEHEEDGDEEADRRAGLRDGDTVQVGHHVRERGARGRVDDRVVVLVVERLVEKYVGGQISAGTCATRPPVARRTPRGCDEERRRNGAARDATGAEPAKATREPRGGCRDANDAASATGRRAALAARRPVARDDTTTPRADWRRERGVARDAGFIATADIVLDANSTSSSRESSPRRRYGPLGRRSWRVYPSGAQPAETHPWRAERPPRQRFEPNP